jgi:hypothetical protein
MLPGTGRRPSPTDWHHEARQVGDKEGSLAAGPPALPRLAREGNASSVNTSDGQDAPRPAGSPRAPALRPRRLVGRDREIAEVTDIVLSSSVTTLMGPGGVGKTALAMTVAAACAESFPDGVIAVWLASLRSAELVGAEVAAALGLPKSGGRSYEDALSEWLADGTSCCCSTTASTWYPPWLTWSTR